MLSAKLCFGASHTIRGALHYVDEGMVAHIAGRHVILAHAHGQAPQVLISPSLENSSGISALIVSPNRKYLAFAENAASEAVVTVLDVQMPKRRKTIPLVGVPTVSGLAFSHDSRFLAIQGAAPGYELSLWQWEKARCLGKCGSTSSDEPIHQVSFHPKDSSLLLATGDRCFKSFRFKDGALGLATSGMQSKREPQNYLAHVWLSSERVLVATDTGDLLLCENFEFKQVLPQSPSDGIAIEALVAYGKGFVCGGNDGSLMIFERLENGAEYRRMKRLKVESEGSIVKIRALSMNPQEEMLAIGTDTGQLYTLNLSAAEFKGDDVSVEPFTFRFHSREITGIATCVRRPLFATCSLDKSVRVWNHIDGTLELCKIFDDEAYSVAMHPSGFHMLVGFRDKLRLCNVLMDDIRPYKEFPIRQCRECRFSNGGALFAAVNGNMIQIYNSYTCEQLGFLRGHNGKVRSLAWSRDDNRLYSCGVDGAVYEWNVRELRRDGENVVKTCQYYAVAAGAVHSGPAGSGNSSQSQSQGAVDGVYAVGSDKLIKALYDSSVRQSDEVPEPLVSVAASRTAVFGGSEAGTLRVFPLPLGLSSQPQNNNNAAAEETVVFQVHRGPLTRLAVTWDESLLISAGDDGCIFVYDIKNNPLSTITGGVGAGASSLSGAGSSEMSYAEEILVTKSDLEEKMSQISDLKAKIEELNTENQYQLRKKEFEFSEKLKDVTESYRDALEKEHARYESLEQERLSIQLDWETRYRDMEEKYTAQIATMETQYQQKIMAEVERVHALQEEKDAMEEHFIDEAQRTQQQHEQVMQDMRESYEERLKDAADSQETLEIEKTDLKREGDEMQRQIEEDADKEIEDLKELYEARLNAEKDTVMRLRGEHGVMKKKFDTQTREIQQKVQEITRLKEEVKTLNLQIKSLEKDIKSLKNEIRERDETIGDKEKRIYDLKKKNQELEKFKFVLDYKINELKKQIEPREEEIAEMRTQIKEMDVELERYHTTNAQLELSIAELKLKIEAMNGESAQQKKKLKDTETFRARLKFDMFEVLQFLQDAKALKEGYRKLYSKYAGDETAGDAKKSGKKDALDEDIEKEYQRQIEYLERTVDSLKRKLQKDGETHKSENARIMSENVQLIKEINELRREIKGLAQGGGQGSQPGIPGLATGGLAGGPGGSRSARSTALSARSASVTGVDAARDRELEMQKMEISKLRQRVEELEEMLANQVPMRPVSRERLPPMEGFDGSEGGPGGRASSASGRARSRVTTPGAASIGADF